ncbi:MAG: aldo/keto reductase [Cyanothece sp. SIO2G6]|nr:aldo/keto reductase [Cyanothece sp. SIO2G6]
MESDTAQQTVQLGSDGPVVPALGIGTWAWGDSLFWSYGKDYNDEQLQQAFHASIEAGVTLFDTAEIYGLGQSERLIGRFLKQTTQPVAIATKYFPLPWRFSADAVRRALDDSLYRLQVASIALYQVHWPFDFFLGQDALINALADEVERGRIQAVGVSNYSAEQMQSAHELLAKRGIPLAVNQMQYSLLERKIEQNGVMATAKDLGITILAYSPLAQGLLTGKYSPGAAAKPQGARSIDPRFSAKGLEKLAPLLDTLAAIAQTYDRTPAQVALNWLMAQGNVIPIPGAKNADQARQNGGALGWTLEPKDVEALRNAAP